MIQKDNRIEVKVEAWYRNRVIALAKKARCSIGEMAARLMARGDDGIDEESVLVSRQSPGRKPDLGKVAKR